MIHHPRPVRPSPIIANQQNTQSSVLYEIQVWVTHEGWGCAKANVTEPNNWGPLSSDEKNYLAATLEACADDCRRHPNYPFEITYTHVFLRE